MKVLIKAWIYITYYHIVLRFIKKIKFDLEIVNQLEMTLYFVTELHNSFQEALDMSFIIMVIMRNMMPYLANRAL